MSDPKGKNAPMKKRGKTKVILEPELEAFAGDWDPMKCLEMGAVFTRWGHQLKIKGSIAIKDACDPGPSYGQKKRRVLHGSPGQKAALN